MSGEHLGAFCWPQSIAPADGLDLFVSARGSVDIAVTRVDGRAPEFDTPIVALAGVEAEPQAAGDDVGRTGCDWTAMHQFDTTDWSPGLYLVAVTPQGVAPSATVDTSWAYVVVRPSRPRHRRVLMLATNTWNAYNDWGGANLYTSATHLSYRRPLPAGFLRKAVGAGERFAQTASGQRSLADFQAYTREHGYTTWHGAAGFAAYEERFVRWSIANDVEIDIVLDRDVHADPTLLDGYDMAVSVGHDEYTTWEQRDHLDSFVADGGRLVFMSGNAHYWQVRIEDDTMVCFKHRYEDDPVLADKDQQRARRVTSIWSDPLIGRPENELTGVSFIRGGYARMASRVRNGSGGYTVHRPEHRFLDGTGLGWGDILGADATVVGYEADGCDMTLVDGVPVPTGVDGTPATFEILASSPVQPFDESSTLAPLAEGGRYELEFHAERLLGSIDHASQARLSRGHAVFGTWTHSSGGWVVTTGCTDWVFGLSDETVAQVTRNMLALDDRLTA